MFSSNQSVFYHISLCVIHHALSHSFGDSLSPLKYDFVFGSWSVWYLVCRKIPVPSVYNNWIVLILQMLAFSPKRETN